MALLHLSIALIIQGLLIINGENSTEDITSSPEVLENFPDVLETFPDVDDVVAKDYMVDDKDWLDFFLLPNTPLYPSSSVAMMEQVACSDKPIEEQLEEIKEMADKITLAIQSEMVSMLCNALTVTEQSENAENATEDNTLRRKRSAESPMDSTKLVTRLLKHIKSNNEYQNLAIEKMMTAQEIADKYGIDYRPDTEILSDLAFAANEQAKEMTSLLEDASNMRNPSKKVNTPQAVTLEEPSIDDAYYVYSTPLTESHETSQSAPTPLNHYHYTYPEYDHYHTYPVETQIPSPPPTYYNTPVTKKPNFYDMIDYYPYCSMPMSPAIPDEVIEPEPELVGEEYEETVTSKVQVDRGVDPGSATVNHVMTYTISEKSHFRTPEIERLPQQMQYCFFLM